VATAPRTIRRTGPLITETDITNILKSIWGVGAEIEVSPTVNANFVFTAKVIFKTNCRKTFPAKYKMNQLTELTLQYAPDCKICYGHDYTLSKCPFKSIHPVWNISLGETGNGGRWAGASSSNTGMTN